MHNGHHKPDPHEALETEAVNWVARLASGEATQSDKQQAQAWRQRSPEHEEAFQSARRLWLGMEGVRETMTASVASQPASTRTFHQAVWRRWAMAAMLALVTLGAVLQEDRLEIWLADYRTGVGEQTSVALSDGSVVHLNTNTALSVNYTSGLRQIELLSGEAQFMVAKDTTRPFVVHAAEGQTRAIGTEFVVHDQGEGATVTLLEGLVEVSVDKPQPGKAARVQLQPGQQVSYDTTDGLAQPQSVNLRLATAWQRGLLIFEGASLRAVVEEINRYRTGYVVLANDEIADQRVSGVFHLDNLDRALGTIQTQLHLSTLHMTDYVVFLE